MLVVIIARHGDPRHLPISTQLGLAAASDVPVVLFLLFILPKLARGTLADIGIRPPTRADLRTALLGAAAMWVAVESAALLMQKLTGRPPNEAAIALLRGVNGPAEALAFALVGAVVAPVAEELAFRAFLFRAIERYVPFWPAAAISGMCFGIVHISAPTATDVFGLGVPLAIGGMVLAYVYARTRCLWTNVAAHAAFNSVSLVAVFAFHVKP